MKFTWPFLSPLFNQGSGTPTDYTVLVATPLKGLPASFDLATPRATFAPFVSTFAGVTNFTLNPPTSYQNPDGTFLSTYPLATWVCSGSSPEPCVGILLSDEGLTAILGLVVFDVPFIMQNAGDTIAYSPYFVGQLFLGPGQLGFARA